MSYISVVQLLHILGSIHIFFANQSSRGCAIFRFGTVSEDEIPLEGNFNVNQN